MTITVKALKEKLQEVVDQLEELEEDAELRLVSNTYFLGHPKMFLGLRSGFISLDCIENSIECEDDEDWEEDDD